MLILAVTVVLAVVVVVPVGAASEPTIIELETVVSGLTAPVGLTHGGDGSGRLFIVEQTGQIRIVEDGTLLATPFLDISGLLPVLNSFFDERGLLGVAFHPSYQANGRFYVRHSAPRTGGSGEPCFGTSRGCHSEVLAEYRVSADDPNLADPTSRVVLFTVDEPQFNHDAGEVAFGPDGFLYFTLGDGGGAHDGLADSPPSHGPIGNGQNLETTLGSILRIDVDHRSVCHRGRNTLRMGTRATDAHLRHGDSLGACDGDPTTTLYEIPNDNPFVDTTGADEIYAYGLRNPYKFSFDDGPGGDGALYLADVGQNLFEEVNIIERGGNYGWVIREGFHCFDPFNPTTPPTTCSDTGPFGEPLIDPIAEYSHPDSGFTPEIGITIIGGFVYRGSESHSLVGKYVFGDFAQAFFTPSGTLLFLDDPSGPSPTIEQFQIGLDDRDYGLFLKGFGEDEDGEVYACGSTALAPTGATGVCQRIVGLD
jgi:glucose/arabinose dehydrogenase